MTLTANTPVNEETSAGGAGAGEKGFFDILGEIVPSLTRAAAPSLGLDPRVAGQTVSQVLRMFGIGGPGKAFTAAIPKDQAASQVRQIVTPHVSDPAFSAALGTWMKAALEPVQAHKEGKDYQPSVDLSKNWFSDAIDSIGHAAASVDWGKVAQVGMQALPYVLAAV